MRQQVSLLRDVLSNMILHRGTDYFTACYEVYHYLENTLQGLPTADSLVHHVDFTTLRRLIAAGVTPVDIQEAKNIEKANYHLVRNIMLELIKDEGLGVFDAVKEIKHVLGHGNQHYAGTYKARLLAANLLPIDTNHAFTQYHLEAMHHMLQELTLRPDEVFQKIYSSAEKEIKRIPLLLREIQGMLVTIGAPLITANFSAADFSRLVLQRNITQNKLLTEQQARTISQMDMFFFQKLFTRKFLAELTRTARIKELGVDVMADQHTLEQYLNKKSSYAERVNLLRDADGWLNCYRGDDCKHLLTQTYIVTALKSIPLPDYTQPPSDKFLQRTLPNYLQQNPSVLQNVIRDRQQLSPSMGLRMYNAVRADPLMTAMEIVFPLILFIILYKGLKRTNFLTRFGYFSTANKSNLPVRNVSKRNLKP